LRLNEEVMPDLNLSTSRYQRLELHQIPCDENAFVDWLVDAKPGDMLAYYRGHLAFDRDHLQSGLGEFRRLKLNHLADRVMETYERRQVLLVQRRIAKNDWLYLAIRSEEPLVARRPYAPKHEARSLSHV
jgi:hypothetical protein